MCKERVSLCSYIIRVFICVLFVDSHIKIHMSRACTRLRFPGSVSGVKIDEGISKEGKKDKPKRITFTVVHVQGASVLYHVNLDVCVCMYMYV